MRVIQILLLAITFSLSTFAQTTDPWIIKADQIDPGKYYGITVANGMKFKRMIPGKILIAEVQGGNKRVEKAFEQMATFMVEHQLIPPAIPFQSLVTDRIAEPDSNKWVTKIFYPVY